MSKGLHDRDTTFKMGMWSAQHKSLREIPDEDKYAKQAESQSRAFEWGLEVGRLILVEPE